MRATFSFDIWANSKAKLTAMEVLPIPPLFENVEIILQFWAGSTQLSS